MKGLLRAIVGLTIIFAVLGCSDVMERPKGYTSFEPLEVSFDLKRTLEENRGDGKRLLLVFTGFSVSSSPGYEWKMLKLCDKDLLQKFHIVCFLVDDKTAFTREVTIGEENKRLLKRYTEAEAYPTLIVANQDLKKIDAYFEIDIDRNGTNTNAFLAKNSKD